MKLIIPTAKLDIKVLVIPVVLLAFVFLISPVHAANTFIKINTPQNGANVVSPVTVSVSYSADFDKGQYPKPTTEMPWKVSITAIGTQPNGATIVFNSDTPITTISGGASASFNLGANSGPWQFTAELMQPAIPFGKAWAPIETARVNVNYSPGAAGNSNPAGANPGVVQPPQNNSPDGDSSPIVPIAVVGGAGAAAALGARALVKKGKKPAAKTPPKPAGPPPGTKDTRSKEIIDASKKYSESLRNKERFEKLTQLRKAVSGDAKLAGFVNDAYGSIVKNGIVDANKLARLDGLMKNWINRDKIAPQMPDYTSDDALWDSVRQGSQSLPVRFGLAYVSGGYSEMALNPISAVSTIRQGIMEDKSTLQAIGDGYKQATFELALGETGRLFKYATPYINNVKESYKLTKLASSNADLASEISTINQLAAQTKHLGKYSRNAFMNKTVVNKLGQTAAAELDDLEKAALNLSNNPEYKELMSKNSELIPGKVKEIMGTAKQKVYQNAQAKAIEKTVGQMSAEGQLVENNPLLIKQTGTHARPGNQGWNPARSDFDHTVEFGSSKYNGTYEAEFNAQLEAQGTSAKALDANVYGDGTSSVGAYKGGGAMKFVENYNQTNGSDMMITSRNGQITVSREETQTINSLLGKMNTEDVASAKANYQNFFQKSLEKGGNVDQMIQNTSKEVSRQSGQYSAEYVQHFQNTGKVNYQVPEAAQVADLVKKKGFSVDNAMNQVGYSGGKEQLLGDFKKLMGM